MDIEWFPIKGYQGLYEWSPQLEAVRSLPRNTTSGKVLKWQYTKQGRPFVCLWKNGNRRAFSKYMCIYSHAHQVEIPLGFDVHHIDGNKDNNEIENMQLLTEKEHIKIHSKSVIALDEQNHIIHRFASTAEAAMHGFSLGGVSTACRGCYNREGNHYYRGLYWFYEDEWLAIQ